MKAYSGVLEIKPDSQQSGRAYIDFDRFPAEGASVADARITQARRVGGTGKFVSYPAYVVHIREYISSDKARGNDEKDHWKLNSAALNNGLEIYWNVQDTGASVLEIGFLVMGN